MADIQDIKKSVEIIALDNLIEDCKESLEYANDDQKEYLQFLIDSSKLLLQELSPEVSQISNTINRPVWKTASKSNL